MNIYQLYKNSERLAGFAVVTESVPEIAWKHFEDDPQELRRREHLWAQDPEKAYWYARDVLDGPFPLGEPVIAENPGWAYHYAHYVLDRPFPLGEPAIAQDPDYALWYAEEVLRGPFPLGEPAIARDNWVIAISYKRRFPERRERINQLKKDNLNGTL